MDDPIRYHTPRSTHPLPQGSRRSTRRAFTLIEILLVIALIGLLAGVTIIAVVPMGVAAKFEAANLFVRHTTQAPLLAYRTSVGRFPSTEEGLAALVAPPPGTEKRWRGPYANDVPEDPWGRRYHYIFPGKRNPAGERGYDLSSLGPDGVESGDDIGNW